MNQSFGEVGAAFNRRATNYRKNEWHRSCAERLVALCELPVGCRVLDACTGTGFAALAAAEAVGVEGHVIGVDISDGMLLEADNAIRASGRTNLELVKGDASHLPQYADSAFDAITCAAGLLYLNVSVVLLEWFRLLRRGGVVGFSSMRAGSPRAGEAFRECAAAFGVSLQDPSAPLGTLDACRLALAVAGFTVRQVIIEPVEFSPQDFAVAWESNFYSPAHAVVQRLSKAEQQDLRRRYLDALSALEHQSPGELNRAQVIYAVAAR